MSAPSDANDPGSATGALRWRLGTMGFSYADWSGPFYPPDAPAAARLGLYAQCFSTVELDTTFHAIPPPAVARRWREATPDDFCFAAKLPRLVTHAPREGGSLLSADSREATARFLESMRELGDKLRAVLMQFPPSFTAAGFAQLQGLVEAWPSDVPAAVELRHDSWWQSGVGPATARLLRGRNMPWVVADEPPADVADLPADAPRAQTVYRPRPAILTADWMYVRWIGRHEQWPDRASERLDPTARLRWWADKLGGLQGGGRVREILGYYNNGYSGHSPTAVRRFLELLGLPVPPTPAQAASLF